MKGSDSNPPDQRVEIAGGDLDVREEAGFYSAYSGFANNLRTWFLAYGVGAPVLFLTNDALWKALKDSGQGPCIAYLFLAGVAIQVLSALMYKTAMWFLYAGELKSSFKKTKRHRCADFISESYAIESIFDLATLVLFGWATLATLNVILQ